MNIRLSFALFILALGATIAWAQVPATAPVTAPATAPASEPASSLKTEKERIGYAVGLQIGGKLKGVDIDPADVAKGLKDGLTGDKPQLSEKEIGDSMMALQKRLMEIDDAEALAADKDLAAAADKNQKAGDAFLLDNAKKDGIKSTASGLQYRVIKTGTGKSPKSSDTVSVNYRGTLITGKEFDASNDGPVSFPVDGVIPGWTEALQLMKEGDKWQVFIPAKLAYGSRPPRGAPIGPNEVLIFEVELLQVK
ncbi:MAG TPA: FKBP-type peptidyl-prolyl cis-trans isomerase [Phycisphaerae bacterium]|jgi:FKBP-type peptidyl-prolyl cis-trans isomerase FklB